MADQTSHGPVTGLTPHLRVEGGKAAVEFYVRAFGATEFFRMPAEDGERLMHSHLRINGGSIMLADGFRSSAARPARRQASPLHLAVADADTWWNLAVAAGCIVKFPLAGQFWGDRYGQLLDPFGHTWSIGAPLKKG